MNASVGTYLMWREAGAHGLMRCRAHSALERAPAAAVVVRVRAALVAGVILSCAAPDGGAAAVEAFFRDLAQQRFEAAADRVRGEGGA